MLQIGGAAAVLSAANILRADEVSQADASVDVAEKPFRYALNCGTLLGFNLSIEEEIDLAAQAGYDAIEPWLRGIDRFVEKGGRLSDLKKRIDDHGLAVAGACAFFPWTVDDDVVRAKGIEQMKGEMDRLRQIGGDRIAATASGSNNRKMDDFRVLGERYRTILDIGVERGVIPQLEVWGKSPTMGCLADVVAIAIHSGHSQAEFLLDVFHLYRGGSSFDALELLNGRSMTNFHVNDYPAEPPREKSEDKDRVYPGDGVAPLGRILGILKSIGFDGFLSFEVFNPTYWATKDPLGVARTGLQKMKALAIERIER